MPTIFARENRNTTDRLNKTQHTVNSSEISNSASSLLSGRFIEQIEFLEEKKSNSKGITVF